MRSIFALSVLSGPALGVGQKIMKASLEPLADMGAHMDGKFNTFFYNYEQLWNEKRTRPNQKEFVPLDKNEMISLEQKMMGLNELYSIPTSEDISSLSDDGPGSIRKGQLMEPDPKNRKGEKWQEYLIKRQFPDRMDLSFYECVTNCQNVPNKWSWIRPSAKTGKQVRENLEKIMSDEFTSLARRRRDAN